MAQSKNQSSKLAVKIKVIGIGGAGGATIGRLIKAKINNIEYIAINTDFKSLDSIKGKVQKIKIGKKITKGLGTGMNLELGRMAIEESINDVKKSLNNADLIFIVSGLGGGTGSVVTPIVAELAKKNGALVIGVMTTPFIFEGAQRKHIADEALKKIIHRVDAMVTIPNSRLLQTIDKSTPLLEAFNISSEILKQAIEGIYNILNLPGLINIDFVEVKSVIENAGETILGMGTAEGEDRARQAAKLALENPLIDISIKGAKKVLCTISGGPDLTMNEVYEITQEITNQIGKEAQIIFGAVTDDNLKNKVKVTIVATGFSQLHSYTPIFEPFHKKEFTETPLPQKSSIKEEKKEILKIEPISKQEYKSKFQNNSELSEDELEIPAYLRKKKG